MTEPFDHKRALHEIEERRSRVRPCVTYVVIGAALLMSGVYMFWVLVVGRYELALGAITGVMGLAGSITGFWFATRKPKDINAPIETTERSTGTTGSNSESPPVDVTGPVVVKLNKEITATAMSRLATDIKASEAVEAKTEKPAQILSGSAQITAGCVIFTFEKVKTKSGETALSKQLSGSVKAPDGGQSLAEGREIMLA